MARERKNAGAQSWDAGASDELGERGRLVVDLGGTTVGIFRIDGKLYAYENTCPHVEGPVCQGLMVPGVIEVLDERKSIKGSLFDESDMRVACPWHGMEFSIKTGRHPANPRLALKKIAVKESKGRIFVEL